MAMDSRALRYGYDSQRQWTAEVAGRVARNKRNGREIIDRRNTRFREHDLEGPVQPEMRGSRRRRDF
jgi:hypothetical protein